MYDYHIQTAISWIYSPILGTTLHELNKNSARIQLALIASRFETNREAEGGGVMCWHVDIVATQSFGVST